MSYKKSVFRSLSMVTQLGLSVVTPIFLCTFAGYHIDSRFQTKLMIPLLILGTLAGARSAWIMAFNIMKAEQREDEQIRRELHKDQGNPDFKKPKEPSRIRSGQPDTDKERDKDGMA